MTSAIRLVPSLAGVSAQIFVNSGARRGFAESWESSLTENRKPCTAPSSGRTSDGPWVAYVQPEPEPSQNDQYRYPAAWAGPAPSTARTAPRTTSSAVVRPARLTAACSSGDR